MIFPGRNILRTYSALKKLIREGGYDIIHCHGARGNMMGALLRRATGLPVVTTVHSDYRLDYMGPVSYTHLAPEKAEKKSKDTDKKADKKAKPGFFARVGKWFKEMKSELKKVQWPTKKTVVKNTGVVIACVIVVGVFIWVFDLLANSVVGALLRLFG